MSDLIYKLRVILPKWFISFIIACLFFSLIVIVLFMMPVTSKSPTVNKIKAFKEAIYWDLRAFQHSEDGFMALLKGGATYEPANETGGILLGVTREGRLLIDTYADDENTEALLADLVIDDALGIAKFMEEYKYQHVLMDSYIEKDETLYIVRFRDGTPINLILIQENLAHANPTPPTSIVDRMMSTYWWNVFNNEVKHYETN
tara:strand:+ start:2050 stop:2658 length:609 start_codon:yes stop_codon:yes gene_type:complete